MLRFITLTFLLLFCARFVAAQSITPKFGITYSKTSRSDEPTSAHYREVNFRSGFMAGLALELPLQDTYFFQTELLYVQKGQKASERGKETTPNSYYHSANLKLDFIEIPMLFKMKMGNGKTKFYPQI